MSDFVCDQVSRNCKLIIPRATRVTDFLGEKCGEKTVIIGQGGGGYKIAEKYGGSGKERQESFFPR